MLALDKSSARKTIPGAQMPGIVFRKEATG